MDLRLKNKIVAIIGASNLTRSLEEIILRNLEEEGAILIILDTKEESFVKARTLQTNEDKVLFYETDTSNIVSIESTIKNVFKKYKRIDVIINIIDLNSRISLETSTEAFMNSLNIENDKHLFLRNKTILDLLEESGGNILNIFSNISIMEHEGIFYDDIFSRLIPCLEKYKLKNSIKENDFLLSKTCNTNLSKEKCEAIANMCLFLVSKKTFHTGKRILYHQDEIHFDDINYVC